MVSGEGGDVLPMQYVICNSPTTFVRHSPLPPHQSLFPLHLPCRYNHTYPVLTLAVESLMRIRSVPIQEAVGHLLVHNVVDESGRKVLPLASKLGVWILIENVWNGFCESPEQYRDYIDEIGSPWVGAYFDIDTYAASV